MGLINWFREKFKKTKPLVKGEIFEASTKKGQTITPTKLNRQTKRRFKGYRTGQFTRTLRKYWAQKNLDGMVQRAIRKEMKTYTDAINVLPDKEVETELKAEIVKGLIKKRSDGRWAFTAKGAQNIADSIVKTWGQEAA